MLLEDYESLYPRNSDEFCAKSKETWQKLLDDKSLWIRIPLLNYTPLDQLRNGMLVRFRGMIQDMKDPEMYLPKCLVKSASGVIISKNMRYRDYPMLNAGEIIGNDDGADFDGEFSERRTLFVVSTPGINEWTKTYEENFNKSNMPVSESAVLDEKDEKTGKRVCNKTSAEEAMANAAKLSESYLVNAPIPAQPGMTCMVVAHENLEEHILNSLIDVIGFLSIDPRLSMCPNVEEDAFFNEQEFIAENPPPLLIPRLHAIAIKPLQHANPLLDISLQRCSSQQSQPSMGMAMIRNSLLQLLQLSLFKDELAAHYLLAHLMSSVHARLQLQATGKFALNICNLPGSPSSSTQYAKKLYELLALLVPTSHYLPMTLDELNTIDFVPKKDYQTNKLISGQLQLSPHTHLVLDETCMEAGSLNPNGVEGFQHLVHLITHQELKCDFKFYKIEYDANIPVLIISEGRSMLPADFILPLQVEQTSAQDSLEELDLALKELQPSMLNQFRCYLTQARLSQLALGNDATQFIEEDFVSMRKAKEINNGDELDAMIGLSRLLAISQGKTHLDKEMWQVAKEFEMKRLKRVRNLDRRAT